MKCGKKWQDILQNVKYFMLKYFFLCIFRDAGYRCDVQQPQPHHLPRMHGSVAPSQFHPTSPRPLHHPPPASNTSSLHKTLPSECGVTGEGGDF